MDVVFEKIREAKIIPVIKLDCVEEAVPLAKALLKGGIPVAEVTFRTKAAAQGIAAIRCELPQMLVGAGTVINAEYARQAVKAGAQFVVAPGFNVQVVDYVVAQGITMIPGVATPTEIEQALCKDLEVLKFFPAEAMGGIKTLCALAGPFANVKFVPTGGINEKNAHDYLMQKNVLAVGGSWMISKNLELVTKTCQDFLKKFL